MLTHGDKHDFTLSVYRDHPYGLKLYHIVLPYHFILHNTLLEANLIEGLERLKEEYLDSKELSQKL